MSSMMEVCDMEEDEEDIPNIDSSQLPIMPVSSQTMSSATGRIVDDGIIEKIVLKNFMCHQHFQVELDSNINFIIGHNGSGKSAIMTGITTGLGGKASTTQRANALSNFVRTGSNEAEIIITLRNKGLEPFKPNEYGQSITVIRQIKRDGGGSYKLKGTSGKVVSSTKDELSRILDHFNIQVDNPVSMLSQDTSRNFLQSSSPLAKYRLFMKGTHLDQIAHDYALAEEQQKLMKEEIHRKIILVPELTKIAKELEEEVKLIGSLDDLEVKQANLSLELSWALVKKSEDRASIAADEVKKEERNIKKIQDMMEKVKSEQDKQNGEKDRLTSILEGISEEMTAIQKEKEDIEQERRNIERLLKDKKAKGQVISRDMEKIKSEKKAFENKLEECRKQNIQDLKGERKELVEQKEELEREIKMKTTKLEAAKNEKQEKETQLREKETDSNNTSSEVRCIRDQIRDCNETIANLQSAAHNSLNVFGAWMTDIARGIDQNRNRFRKVPKGPLGSFVKVIDHNWCQAIECSIGFYNLCGFIVDNQHDGDILREIMQNVLRSHRGKPHPPVFTSSFSGRVYDVTHNMPRCSYPTVLSMVDVVDPDIMNIMIDMFNIESTILIRDAKEARSVMGNKPPYNARNAYTIEGHQALPNYRFYSNKKKSSMGILQVSVQDGILHQTSYLNRLEEDLRIAIDNNEQCQSIILLLKRDKSKINDYINRELRNIRELQSNIEKIEMRLDDIDSTDQQEEDIATWEGVIKELEDKLIERKGDLSLIKEEMMNDPSLLRSVDERLLEHDDKVKDVTDRLRQTRKEFKTVTDRLDKVNRGHRMYDEQMKKIKDNLSEKETVAKQLAEQAAQYNEDTKTLGERINTDRTPTSIDSEISKIEKKLQQEAGRRANQDEIEKKYMEAVESLKSVDKSIKEQQKSLDKLHSSLKLRIEGYRDLRRRIANRARLYFQNYIQKRGYQGTLKFSVSQKKLEIIVKVDKNQATKNVASLSGGERSFSTVSFIMALWEAIECPFRCFDEFDVFMDLLNRKISMRLMLDNAKTLDNRQFIFFTPQNMSSLGIDFSSFKVLELNPPDRTQPTLEENMT